MGLSIRAYAAHRGVSHTSVRKAISSGRITLSADGTIDPAIADPDIGAVRDTLSEAGSPLVGGMSYVHAKTAEKVLTVQLLRERLRREKGEVLDRQAALQQGYAFARRLRDAWLAWPARVAAVMAADLGVDAHRLEVLLDAHVREQLQATANEELTFTSE
ncbi:MAG: hypothetical protein B7Z29_19865 [Hyphomicrobium sp. 12-62-95]|nr:MAG: hypothetical protein B7Z29_19865 [Hyphomicrobium sp. 12-62-95]